VDLLIENNEIYPWTARDFLAGRILGASMVSLPWAWLCAGILQATLVGWIFVVSTTGAFGLTQLVGLRIRVDGLNVAIWAWKRHNSSVIPLQPATEQKDSGRVRIRISDWNSRIVIQYNYSHARRVFLRSSMKRPQPRISAWNTGTIVRYNISQNDRAQGHQFLPVPSRPVCF